MSRDQLIEILRIDVARYTNKEHWILLRQSYFALQQQYVQISQDFHRLERKYENLEDKYINLFNRFKKFEEDDTELRTQYNQVRDDQDRLKNDVETSKRVIQKAEARYWASEVQYDYTKEQKTKIKKQAGVKKRLLTDLAIRIFKRTISITRVLIDMEIDPMDSEQKTLYQLIYKHLDLSAKKIANSFVTAKTSEERAIENERGESST